jgi:hypothetical protein
MISAKELNGVQKFNSSFNYVLTLQLLYVSLIFWCRILFFRNRIVNDEGLQESYLYL